MAADVLRARRFPEDALDYYGYALTRGGDAARIALKQGVTELELQNVTLARACFKRAAKLEAEERRCMEQSGGGRVSAASICDTHLGLQAGDQAEPGGRRPFTPTLERRYFERKSFQEGASSSSRSRLKLDPEVFEKHSGSGVMAHMLSPADRGRFCYELAKLALGRGDEAEMLHWLAKASEAAFDCAPGWRVTGRWRSIATTRG